MRSKWFARLIILALLAFWGAALVWNSERDKRIHKEMIAVFQEMDTYGSFPLISAAIETPNISDYDSYIRDGKLTYSFFYNSTNIEKELTVYEKYLLQHGYDNVTPTESVDELIAVYEKLNPDENNYPMRIRLFRTEGGYELQLSGF